MWFQAEFMENKKRMSSKFFIWRLKMDTSISSLVIMPFFSGSRSYTSVTYERRPQKRSDVARLRRRSSGGGGRPHFSRYFWKWRVFFFVLAFLPQGKRCFQAETQSFKNGLQRGDFLKTPAYRFCAEGKGCYRISSVISFSCARAKTGHTLHVYANFFENGEKKYPFFPFRYARTWRRPNFQKRLSNWWLHLGTQFKTSGRSVWYFYLLA